MKRKEIFVYFFAFLLVVLLFFELDFCLNESARFKDIDVFVGVDAAYDDVEGIKKFVDEVRSYTNLFVVGSTGITYNVTKLDEVCQYLYDKGLYFLVFFHPNEGLNQSQWIEDAKTRWGDAFLGFYAFDEVGGRQLDRDTYMLVREAKNYSDAANKYIVSLGENLKNFTKYYGDSGYLPLFTSDYALYWFDYRAGYDVVFGEFGWNYSRQLNVALCRGAATAQNKDWGVMITWTYNNPPYIESGEALYDDMLLAYNNGAKYIVVFDTNKNYTQGILKEEHLDALKKFWDYIWHNPRTSDALTDRVAYVLPKDYGYGFRGPNDTIWGLWEADALSYEISTTLHNLMQQYRTKLDIIYDDKKEPYNISLYNELIFWNGTIHTIP